jgi:hypothetical protein
MHIRTAWSDFFTVSSPTNPYFSQTYNSRLNPSATSVYVLNCLFRSISSSSDGGALYCTSVTYFLVESTSFFSCKTSTTHYGAIHLSISNGGQSVLYGVCGYDCFSNQYYQFGYMYVNNVASNKNYVNYSSIARCVNENSNSYFMLALGNGKNCCPSVNMSLNKCYCRSGITSWPTGDSSITCSSFANNHAIGHTCFWLNTGGANYEMKNCNILRNTQGTLGTQGTIYTASNLKIEDSCILENTATYIFYQESSSYTITLSNCTVDKTTYNQKLVIQNTVTKSFILALNHMSTQNCHSGYDSAGYLTPNIQTPSPSKKQRICYTIGNFPHLSRLSDFFSFNSIFIFNFIYPYNTNYP